MTCLFCDQRPETKDAIEKLAEIIQLVGPDPVAGVKALIDQLEWLRQEVSIVRGEYYAMRDRMQANYYDPTRAGRYR